MEIVNDGADGGPAIIRTCGPDDLLDYINANTLVDELLGERAVPGLRPTTRTTIVEACTEYRLADGRRASSRSRPRSSTCRRTPRSRFYVGDFMNGGGELEQWTGSGTDPIGGDTGVGEMQVTNSRSTCSRYYGFGEAEGVELFAYVPIPLPGIPEDERLPSSSFTQSGVSADTPLDDGSRGGHRCSSVARAAGLRSSRPPWAACRGTNSFTRVFGVGAGSGGEGLDLEIELSRAPRPGPSRGCVTVGGVAGAGGSRSRSADDDGSGAIAAGANVTS